MGYGGLSMSDKTIGIVGVDYCGSTLLNYVWDGLPGVFGAGESHWIVDKPEILCRQCNRLRCIVWKPEVREQLPQALDDGKWEALREMANADIVVSSDKKPIHYEQFGVPSRLVFSFKDPLAQIFSRAAVLMGYNDAAVSVELGDDVIDEATTWWVDETNATLEWIMKQDPEFKVVKIELLVDDPKAHLKAFCDWAGVKYDESALMFWRKRHHYIGGNHSLSRLKRSYYFFRQFRKDERWKESFTQDQIDRITKAADVRDLTERLNELLVPGKLLA